MAKKSSIGVCARNCISPHSRYHSTRGLVESKSLLELHVVGEAG
jgi:hypothetical protein